jgi:transketolase
MTHELAREIKTLSLEMVTRAKASHIGSAFSIADIVAVLYGSVLNVDPLQPKLSTRDRFILSKGHACVAVYSALAARGFFPKEDLVTYGQDHSLLMNHISHKISGVEFSTGSLGHGLPFGVGKALAANKRGENWRTFVLMSDGELGEGSNWEAFMFAAHHQLSNLVAIIDYNKLQSLTSVDKTLRVEP